MVATSSSRLSSFYSYPFASKTSCSHFPRRQFLGFNDTRETERKTLFLRDFRRRFDRELFLHTALAAHDLTANRATNRGLQETPEFAQWFMAHAATTHV